MGKFKSEISLLEQAFVIDPNTKVKNFIGEDTIESDDDFSDESDNGDLWD